MFVKLDQSIFGSSAPIPRASRVKIVVLAGLLIFHIIFSLFLVAPGYFTVDEGIYHLMSREFAASGGLTIWNGYEEIASRELVLLTLRVHNEGLVAQYPPLFVILVSPPYWIAGFHGLFLGNALAFAGVVWLCFLISQKLFRDLDLSLDACLILVLATFAWQYSQAAWPHAVSMLFVIGAFHLVLIALDCPRERTALVRAFLAGLVTGFGVGVRLDVIFVLPALVLPFLFVSPWRPWRGLAVGVGMLPGLAVLAVMNHVKFGIASPFTYGQAAGQGSSSDPATYLGIFLVALVPLAAIWVFSRDCGRAFVLSHRWAVGFVLAIVGALFLASPQGWAMISRLATGSFQLLIDMRIRDLDILEGALSRGPTGGMIYQGILKKSLLQSCPYLVVLALPLLDLVRGTRERAALGLLFIIPFVYVGVYSYFAWHGGRAFNMRYFLPMTPFLAVLTAYAWRRVPNDLSDPWIRVCKVAVFGVLTIHLLDTFPPWESMAVQEQIFLSGPLLIAAILLVLFVCSHLSRGSARQALQRATTVAMIVALLWSGMVAITYDYPRDYVIRMNRSKLSNEVARVIKPDSILFESDSSVFFGLIDMERIRFAEPKLDDFEDFARLLRFHLDSGRPVYLWLDREMKDGLRKHHLLDQLDYVPIFERTVGTLVQVTGGPD